MILRVDPWAPEYDVALQIVAEDDPDAGAEAVDAGVETTSWRGIVPELGARLPLCLVDGVRRVDLRVLAGDAEPLRYGLFGSLAVGAVRLDERALLDEPVVQRALMMGGGAMPEPVRIEGGQATLDFAGHPVADNTPEASLAGLQALMRQAEAALATGLSQRPGSGESQHRLVIVDGPLTYLPPSAAPIVGYIKRLRRAYLAGTHAPLLAQLPVGGRTPLFLIRDGAGRFDRYSWYVRLAPPGPAAHPLASVVRLEVSAAAGLEAARRAADTTAQHLPDLASTPDRDPRAPQNLVPVGALERDLRHRLGDPRWIRRLLMQRLLEMAA